VRKLAALLRLADALDRDHEGHVRGLRCEIGDDRVRIQAICSCEDETMRWRLEERADLFAEVFGREVELITTLGAADHGEVFPSVFGLMERG
jgi:exopolyphosphatase/guanosine-5'-triphosphate,3'-diphosphate pyrophosphatase